MPDEYFLEPRAVRRSFDSASATFDASAAVHNEIRGRLLERLDLVRIDPAVVIDLGAGTGHASSALKRRYSAAHVIAADLSPRMLHQARRQQRLFRRFTRIATDAHHLALRSDVADLVFSNLMLQWCSDPDLVFTEIRRVLKTNGLLTFTTLGPDTLRELRSIWSRVDRSKHVHRFIDMHDLGDALLRAGFAEPVMDTERLTVTYASFDMLIYELRSTGSRNIAHGRLRGLTGRTAVRRIRHEYEALRRDAVLPVTLEVVYGHAWAAAPRSTSQGIGEVRVPIGAIRKK